ncbi:MAG: SH3 domain-containing protein [Lachnospiraceae bacterium]|nr:SH3 domain-containing protein [Lachnospiraceae bacterium]
MRKRFLAAILAVAMTVSLPGCGSASTAEEVVETEETEEGEAIYIEEEPEEENVAEEAIEETETDSEPVYEEVFYTVEVSAANEDGTYTAYDTTSAYLITLAEEISDETKELFAEGTVLTVTTLVEATEDLSTDTVEAEESADTSESDSSTDTEEAVSFDYDTVIEITVVDAAVVEDAEASALVQLVFGNENGYTVQDMDETTMYATRSVNVRSGPFADTDKLGTLSKAQEVTVTGLTSTDWYRVSYNGGVAYVSANYLANEKPTTTTTAATTT